ncbi:50S ribosomal protein L22 [archaeon]|nr:50S ribosomal protein L22 [archaeon]
MPHWGYSIRQLPLRSVKASGRELDISPKDAREICRAIKGMKVTEAESFLKDVIAMRRSVPYRRYRKKVAHKRGLQGWYAGRYPVKAAKAILKILQSAMASAEEQDLDVDSLYVYHAAAYKGRVLKRYIERAFGRTSPWNRVLVHVELVLSEEKPQ